VRKRRIKVKRPSLGMKIKASIPGRFKKGFSRLMPAMTGKGIRGSGREKSPQKRVGSGTHL